MATSREVISTDKAPAAVGPYSQAIKAGNTVYVSGQIALVPGTKNFASEEVEGQTEQVMKNMGAILEAAGMVHLHVHLLGGARPWQALCVMLCVDVNACMTATYM